MTMPSITDHRNITKTSGMKKKVHADTIHATTERQSMTMPSVLFTPP
jgi:hypothetical protein